MNLQHRIRAVKMLCAILIIELVCVAVEAKIREHSHHHHHGNALLRRLHRHGQTHHRRAGSKTDEETTVSGEPADQTDPTTAAPTDPSTDPSTTTTVSPELALEAKQLVAKIEKDMHQCDTVSSAPEVEYTPPSMPPHIDRNYFHVTQRVPYYTVGSVDPIGFDPPAVKLTSCEKLYRKHVRNDLYSDDPETEESLETARLPKDKKRRDEVIRDMFEVSDENL